MVGLAPVDMRCCKKNNALEKENHSLVWVLLVIRGKAQIPP